MSTATPNGAAAPAKAPPRKGLVPPAFKPYLAPVLITCILAVGESQYRILESYWHTGLAIAASILLEVILGRWVTGKWPHLASAYITGISVGILVRSNELWPYIACSLLAISSKYALRVRGRHLFNPSNLGVSILLWLEVIYPLSQQWGNEIWPSVVILFFGMMILYTLGRLHITLTYLIAFTLLSFLRSSVSGRILINELSLLTQPSYQLFMFFMITDPRTTTLTWRRQCVVAVLVAVVETLLRLYGPEIAVGLAAAADWILSPFGGGGVDPLRMHLDVHAPYYALFVVAPVTNLIEIWWDSRRTRKAAPAGAATPMAPSKDAGGPRDRVAAPANVTGTP
jgi:Na+-translocating ferredoxin:NAD+ oxidoreductase RnfD subunit